MCLIPVSMVTTSESALIYVKNVLFGFDNTKSERIYEVVYFFFFFLQRWEQVCCCCCSPCVSTLGRTQNPVVKRSLALILALVRRHSCFSSPSAALVNLQKNRLLYYSCRCSNYLTGWVWHTARRCSTHHRWPTPRVSAALLVCVTFSLLFLFAPPSTNQWGHACGDQGQLLPTSWPLSSSKFPL